jgi:hypothetical protein
MNVAVLQQFLHSLVPPLQAGGGQPAASNLDTACRALEPFRERNVAEFAEFLTRCQDYERQGHWPSRSPSIAGDLIDEPTAGQYADRLRALLQREATAGMPSAHAQGELKKLERLLQVGPLQTVARHVGVSAPAAKKPALIKQIVGQLTGQPVTDKPASRRPAKLDDAGVRSLADRLQQVAGTPALDGELQQLESQQVPVLKSVAAMLGVKVTSRTKTAVLGAIRSRLTPAAPPAEAPNANAGEVDRWVEIVKALKAKAEVPGAPEDEIEMELRRLQQEIDRDMALAVCDRLGIGRTAKSLADAFDAIRRKVFELKRARDSVAY